MVAMVHVIDVTVDLLASTFSLASIWDVGQSLCGTKSATRKEEVEDKSVTAGPNGVHLSNPKAVLRTVEGYAGDRERFIMVRKMEVVNTS